MTQSEEEDDDVDHNDRVREQFRTQAQTFNAAGFATRGLDWIVDTIDPDGTEVVLDVACGAAHVGRALASRSRYVHGIDLVPEMLEQARNLAESDSIRNLALARGDASHLPWIDDQFDLVVCRLALHQVDAPAAMVREMVRVARPGGRVVLVDMVADPDPALAAETNRLERLRDPSHGRTLSAAEIPNLSARAGARVESQSIQDQPLDLEDWMERTDTPSEVRDRIRERLDVDLAGGSPTGLFPARDAEGRVTFVHPWTLVIARVP